MTLHSQVLKHFSQPLFFHLTSSHRFSLTTLHASGVSSVSSSGTMSDSLDDVETLRATLPVVQKLPLNIENACERSNAAPTARKPRKFAYLSTYKEFLAKCVREHDAHKVGYRKKIEAFETVWSSFIKLALQGVFDTHDMTSVKFVRDHYTRLKECCRNTAQKMAPLFEKMETLFDLDILLDDLIREKDDFEEQKGVECDG